MIDIVATPGSNIGPQLRVALPSDDVRIVGQYLAGQQTLPNGRVLCGTSRDVDKITRDGPSKTMLVADNTVGVVLRDLHLELAPYYDYTIGLKQYGGANLSVLRCKLTAPFGQPPGGNSNNSATPTLMGVLTYAVDGVLVEDVELDGAQIKVGGSGVRVYNTTSYRAQNFGVSCVSSGAGEVHRDVVIEGALIESPNNGGIYVGTDSDQGTGGELHDLFVGQAVIHTSPTYPTSCFGVIGRIGARASNWNFEDITIEPTDLAKRPANAFKIKAIDVGAGAMEGLLVSNVRARGSDLADIDIHMRAGGWATIQFSEATGGRGIKVRGHGVVTIAGCVSSPRGTHPALTLIGEGGLLEVNGSGNTWNGPRSVSGSVVVGASL